MSNQEQNSNGIRAEEALLMEHAKLVANFSDDNTEENNKRKIRLNEIEAELNLSPEQIATKVAALYARDY